MNILKINNLRKSYGKLLALNSLNLTIEQGNVYGILGPNGSGKTTTLAILLGILKSDSGDFSWFGQSENINSNKNIGALLEQPYFYPYLSIEDNLKIVCEIKQINKSEHIEEIDRVLSLVKLINRKKSRFQTLSLGMKQRLAIGALLIGDPQVLVLDEPTNGLDPQGIAEVRDLIKDQAERGKTIILASHILDEVEKVCSHVAILRNGKLLSAGLVADLLHKKGGEQIIVSCEDLENFKKIIENTEMVNFVQILKDEILIEIKPDFSTANINEFAFSKGFILSKIVKRKQTLEQEFLKIVRSKT